MDEQSQKIVNQFATSDVVDYSLWRANQGCLQCGCTGTNDCHFRLCEQTVRRVVHHHRLGSGFLYDFVVKGFLYRRSPGNHKLIAIYFLCRLQHFRQRRADLLHTASCQQSYNRFVVEILRRYKRVERLILVGTVVDSVGTWIAHIIDLISTFSKPLHLKRQYRIDPVDILLYILQTILLPRPQLRSYIIMNGSAGKIFLHKLSNLKVEARIIHQDHDVWFELDNRFLAILHILQDFTKMCDDGDESHIRHVTVMLHKRAALVVHHVATQPHEFSLMVLLFQRFQKSGRMQISRRLSCDYKVLHLSNYTMNALAAKSPNNKNVATTNPRASFHRSVLYIQKNTNIFGIRETMMYG